MGIVSGFIADEFFQCGDVRFKSLTALLRGFIPGEWLAANEGFLHTDIISSLKALEMGSQVSICSIDQFLECIEINGIIDHQGRHNPQAYAAVKSLVQCLDEFLHAFGLLNIMMP